MFDNVSSDRRECRRNKVIPVGQRTMVQENLAEAERILNNSLQGLI